MGRHKHLFNEFVKTTPEGYVVGRCSKCGENMTMDKKTGGPWLLVEDAGGNVLTDKDEDMTENAQSDKPAESDVRPVPKAIPLGEALKQGLDPRQIGKKKPVEDG